MSGRQKRAGEKATEIERLIARSPFSRYGPYVRTDLYPEEQGTHIWTYRGTNCTIVCNDQWAGMVADLKRASFETDLTFDHSIKWMTSKIGNMNGYARFPRRPLYERGYHGIATYVPAPGGITYAQAYADGSFVYGYDTGHTGQEGVQFKDVSWHVVQVEFMVDAILIARRLERAYRDAKKREERAAVLVEFDRRLRLRGKQIDVQNNFGVMLNLLSGQL